MEHQDCAICGAIVEENSVELTADWNTEPRRDGYMMHERCANSVLSGWNTPWNGRC